MDDGDDKAFDMERSFTKVPVIGRWRSQERGFVRPLTSTCPLRPRYDPEIYLLTRARIGARLLHFSGLRAQSRAPI